MLMILTSMVGMALAPVAHFSWLLFFCGNLGIALLACSAASINHLMDRHIDRVMRRTQHRPIAKGNVSERQAIIFSVVLCVLGLFILIRYVNNLTALLTFLTLIGYAGIYTMYLKHATPQNIVIGGLAGAAPPLLGWVAMTGHVDLGAILLLLIIFVWTPPHFWALAIYRVDEYAKADVPMLPVTHGILHTKKNIFWYTIVLSLVTLLPCLIGMSHWVYLLGVIFLNARFIQLAAKLLCTDEPAVAMSVFRYSIIYLMLLFVLLLVDHFC